MDAGCREQQQQQPNSNNGNNNNQKRMYRGEGLKNKEWQLEQAKAIQWDEWQWAEVGDDINYYRAVTVTLSAASS